MKYTLLFLISAQAYCYDISNAFLYKLATIESDNRPTAIGDSSHALGLYQLHKSAWDDACKRNGVKWEFNRQNAFNVERSTIVAKWHLEWLAERLEANGYEVTPMRLYMCYNLGMRGALKLNLQPTNIPSLKRAKKILNTNEHEIQSKPESELDEGCCLSTGLHNRRVSGDVISV
jgi:soluble lytic murein transglycosylase-like protein